MSHESEAIGGNVTAEAHGFRDRHNGCVIWLTGLPAAGKSTIAAELQRELERSGKAAYVIDGDQVRRRLCSDLGFSPEHRRENVRRVAETAVMFADAGVTCIVALVSPVRSDREMARHLAEGFLFIEVYVNAPVNVCIQRDPKGLYAKAAAGEIKHFTGVSALYEPPLKPELELPTDQLSMAAAVRRLHSYLARRLNAP